MILYFWILLAIIELVLLIKNVFTNNKYKWIELLLLEALSFVSIGVQCFINIVLDINIHGDALITILGVLLFIPINLIFLIITIIFMITKKKTLNYEKTKRNYKTFIIMYVICVLFFGNLLYTYYKEENKKKDLDDIALSYLTMKYGDSNFQIESKRDLSKCNSLVCLFKENAMEYQISNDYTEELITIKVDITIKMVEEENFIDIYVKEKGWCDDNSLDMCIESLVRDDISLETNDYKTLFNLSYNSSNKIYGHVPSLEELKENVSIEFREFEISKSFNSNEEELKMFLINLYKVYMDKYAKYEDTDIINFSLINGNPFVSNNDSYNKGGYVKITEDKILLYYRANPTEISFDDKRYFD